MIRETLETILAQQADVSQPTSITGMLAALVATVTVLLSLVVKWLLSETRDARKDASEAWKAANTAIIEAQRNADIQVEKTRAFYGQLSESSREVALAWQELAAKLPPQSIGPKKDVQT